VSAFQVFAFKLKVAVSRIAANGRSPVGCIAATTHAVVFTTAIFSQPKIEQTIPCELVPKENEVCFDVTVIAGREFHFAYDSPTIQFFRLVDVPAHLLGAIIFGVPLLILNLTLELCGLPYLSLWTMSYVGAAIWIVFGFIEWWLMGAWEQRKVAATIWRK